VCAALPALCGGGCGLSSDGGHRGRCRNWRGLDFRRLRRRSFDNGSGRHWRRACCGSHGGRWFGGRLFFARSRGRSRLNDHPCRGRRNHDHRSRSRNDTCGSLGYNGAGGRTRSDGRRGWRRGNNRRGRARLRNDLARSRMSGSRSRCSRSRRSRSRSRRGRGRGRRSRFGWRSCCRLRRHARLARLFFFFLLLGQDGLQHIARLGDVREVDLGDDSLSGMAARCSARMGRGLGVLRKTRTNHLRLVQLQGTGVRLDASHAEFRENVENRPRLNFQLARQIVDTNLAHPPLFNNVLPNRP
jgi:hypothetical protein